MAVIWRVLEKHFPDALAAIVFDYCDPLENALMSIVVSGREFWYEEEGYSGRAISVIAHLVYDDVFKWFNAKVRPCIPGQLEKPFPMAWNIYWRVKGRCETVFLGQQNSLGYVLWCASKELLRYGKTTSRRRRERRKKLRAMRGMCTN